MTMNHLTLWYLKRFCERHEIDVHEIDNTLSHGENKSHLEGFLMRTPEELAKEYGRISNIMNEEIPLNKKKETAKKQWIPRESKQKWVTISKTHIEIHA